MEDRSARAKCLSSRRLGVDFGPRTALARNAVRVFYSALAGGGEVPRGAYERWKSLFANAVAWDLETPNPPLLRLARQLELCSAELSPGRLVFALHSYMAALLKLLAAHVLAAAHGIHSPLERLGSGTADLRATLADVESGGFFRRLHIANYPDDDFFGWYRTTPSNAIAETIADVAQRLAGYERIEPRTDPNAAAQDLFKEVYQSLIPKSVRHALGEYYTPDWIARHTLDELAYHGNPAQRLLDPACGSGTFLVEAIRRMYARDPILPAESTATSGTLPPQVVHSIIGFDVNPLAVLSARTNYLVALRALGGLGSPLEIPVYLRDSLFPCGRTDRRFSHSFDFVVGNPPWIAWDHLPVDYRERSKPLWHSYGLFSLSATEARHGGGKKDLSMLMLYVSADRFLKDRGRLGFVMTQTVFQSQGAGAGFRRFRLGTRGVPLRVHRVDDLVALRPFRPAANWTSIIFVEKGADTTYPVPYIKWTADPSRSADSAAASGADRFRRQSFWAAPVDSRQSDSPWLLQSQSQTTRIAAELGPSDYVAHLGANSGGANGVYWVEIVGRNREGVVVRNVPARGKRLVPAVERTIEPDLLYPLLRWGDVSRFAAAPSLYVILAQDPQKRQGLDPQLIQQHYPRTWAYLNEFREQLCGRAAYRRYLSRAPFYSMYDVDTYTLAPLKVVWRRMDRRLNAAVVQSVLDPHLGRRAVIPQETCVLVEVKSSDEGYYLCAMINSEVADRLVRAHSVQGGKGFGTPSMLQYLPLRKYCSDDARHRQLALLSRNAHDARASGQDTTGLQREIDTLASDVWTAGRRSVCELLAP